MKIVYVFINLKSFIKFIKRERNGESIRLDNYNINAIENQSSVPI